MSKYNFGTIFLLILTAIFIAIGCYFVKQYYIFSVVFFIGAIINIVFIQKEISSQKNGITNYNEENIPEELEIRYSVSGGIITILIYSIFLTIALFGLIVSKAQLNLSIFSTFGIIFLFIGIFIIMTSLEIRKMSKIYISINQQGIQLQNNLRMGWNDIQQEKIISKYIVSKDSRHQSRIEINYLYFFYNNQKIEIKIDELNITDYNLSQFLKIYRERYNKQISLS